MYVRLAIISVTLGIVWLGGTQNAAAQGSNTQDPIRRDQPVAFTADSFQYDRNTGIVTASGHVEAWQGDHVLRADKITFDRNTNVAAASGNVVLVEPDGQVLFADYAELTQGMREGVLRSMRTLLAENGQLAANGARRVEGKVNELTHAVYTTCNLCKTDPSKPPLWQLRAYSAVQDVENHRIEYQDATLEMFGLPVAYLPWLSHADPSVRRSSGFLVPSFGDQSHIGAFLATPYFWAIDNQQDVTLTPEVTTQSGPKLSADYRRRFNEGRLLIDASTAYDENKPQGYLHALGNFAYDDTYRYGFNINIVSSTDYMRDFNISGYESVLTSTAFIEGFGVGSYTKLDTIAYQGLATTITQNELPYVLPRYQYSYFGEPDAWGGRFRFDTEDFNVIREVGTNTQRASASLDWQRPFVGDLGELYNLQLHLDSAAYVATSLNQQPSFSTDGSAEVEQAEPTAALKMSWPFMRTSKSTGTQTIEPIVQLVGGPNAGSFLGRNIPNEDSLAFEFTDSNLFSINRFPGIDRFEGGLRANVGVHTSWLIDGASIDTVVGQVYREHLDRSLPLRSGLDHHVSDVVARTTFTPNSWLDLTARTRVDPRNGNIPFIEGVASAGQPLLRVSSAYFYSSTNPYFLFNQAPSTEPPNGYPASYFIPREEVTLGVSTQHGPYKLSASATRDLKTSQMDSIAADASYEDECFIFDVKFNKIYTSIDNEVGGTSLLFQITFKTVGQFGFHAS